MARVSKQVLLDRSDRNMASGTHPVVRESALEVVRRAYDEGINAQISEGFRSYARQNELYAQGRTTSGKIVTNAKGGQSWHNFGIAVDYFLTTNDGSKALWTVNSKWRRVAEIAKNLGFEWGGDWKSFKDYPHLQMTGGLSLAQMRAGKKPKLTSKVDKPVSSSGGASSSGSVVDYMNKNNMDSSYKNRKKLAIQYGISGYKGTASQNIELLNYLKSGKDASVGWIENNKGWWYKNTDGSYPKDEWKKINGSWFLFDDKGYMLTGWQKVKNKWYYMNKSGRMQTGWIRLKDEWYYLDKSGAMLTGWYQTSEGGPWFHSKKSGRMDTGWLKSGNNWFYLESNGHMLVGLHQIGKNHFYFDNLGHMLENGKVELSANKDGHLS